MKPGPVGRFLTKDKWIKGRYAEDKQGNWCDPRSDRAVKWCLVGAITHEGCDLDYSVMRLEAAVPNIGNLTRWNDAPERTWAEVRRAILKAKI